MPRINQYTFHWGPALGFGLIAFLVGYLLTRHFALLGQLPETSYDASDTVKTGWLYFNAHTVPLTESANFFGEEMRVSGYDFISRSDASPYLEFLYVLPPIALIFCGTLSAARRGRTHTLSFAVLNGATITVGYFCAVLVGVIAFSASTAMMGAGGTVRPALFRSILVSGLLYPLVFGGLGGLVYFLVQGSIQVSVK